jgi:hypothetical protein
MDKTCLIHAIEGMYIDYRISRGSNHASRDRHYPASSANVKVCSLCTETIAVQLIFVANGQTEATSWMRSPNSFVLGAQIATAGPNRNFRRAVRLLAVLRRLISPPGGQRRWANPSRRVREKELEGQTKSGRVLRAQLYKKPISVGSGVLGTSTPAHSLSGRSTVAIDEYVPWSKAFMDRFPFCH